MNADIQDLMQTSNEHENRLTALEQADTILSVFKANVVQRLTALEQGHGRHHDYTSGLSERIYALEHPGKLVEKIPSYETDASERAEFARKYNRLSEDFEHIRGSLEDEQAALADTMERLKASRGWADKWSGQLEEEQAAHAKTKDALESATLITTALVGQLAVIREAAK